MRVKWYELVSRAVEEGAAHGVRRAFKHTDKPDPVSIRTAVEDEVMNALSEVFDFEPETLSVVGFRPAGGGE